MRYFILTLFFLFSCEFHKEVKKDLIGQEESFYLDRTSNKERYELFWQLLDNSKNVPFEKWMQFLKEKEQSIPFFSEEYDYYLLLMGHLYFRIGDNEKALGFVIHSYYNRNHNGDILHCEFLKLAHSIYSHTQNNRNILVIINEKIKYCNASEIHFHEVYRDLGLFVLALNSYKENKQRYFGNTNFSKGKYYNNVGFYFYASEHLDSAKYYYNKALKSFNTVNKDSLDQDKLAFWIGLTKGNLGQVFLNQANYDEALRLISDDYRSGKKYLNSSAYIKYTLSLLIEVYTKKDDNNKVKKLMKKYRQHMNTNNTNIHLSNFYYIDRKFDSSVYYYKKRADDGKLISKPFHYMKYKTMEGFFNYKEQFLNEIEQQEQLDNLEINFDKNELYIKYMYNFLFFFIGLVSIVILLFLEKTKQAKLINRQKRAIEISLLTKKKILRSYNSNVKNDLENMHQYLNVKFSSSKKENTFDYYKGAISDINAIIKEKFSEPNSMKNSTFLISESLAQDLSFWKHSWLSCVVTKSNFQDSVEVRSYEKILLLCSQIMDLLDYYAVKEESVVIFLDKANQGFVVSLQCSLILNKWYYFVFNRKIKKLFKPLNRTCQVTMNAGVFIVFDIVE